MPEPKQYQGKPENQVVGRAKPKKPKKPKTGGKSAGALRRTAEGLDSRRVAIKALERITGAGSFANLVLGPLLDRSSLEGRDRALVTEMVYGTTRMQRALDHLIDQFLLDEVDHHTRSALRLGTYQIHFMNVPTFAAVDATVGASKKRVRGLVNAVLRKVADAPHDWPSDAVRLSYPDWIVDRLSADLGRTAALEALEAMNEAAITTTRDDGYVQDPASQEVVALLEAQPGELILDLCAAPGGKATGLAASGAFVVAGDLHAKRARLVRRNATSTGSVVAVLAADARSFPVREDCADAVLLDAPCSGLGSLRRRADARWRIDPDAPVRLGAIQRELLLAAAALVKPGGRLMYSVCTLTTAETTDVIKALDWPASAPVVRLPSTDSDGMWSQMFTRPQAGQRAV
ncbi:MAG: hypothetical protein HKN03_09970 [Acidimicrobiales bacterium]|nr:hypothetical protein [Acidimicrobiales bacterium]